MEKGNENQKTLLDPTQSDIKISNKKENKSYIFISKIILKKFGFVELVSLGNTCEKAVNIAEILVRGGFATIVEFVSDEVKTDNENYHRRATIKLYIKWVKTDKFDSLVEGVLK